LINAFRATLEEVQEAALLLQVSDISNPHHDELNGEVEKILDDLGVKDTPRLKVFNKVDQLDGEQRKSLEALASRNGNGERPPVMVSGLTGEGLEELLRQIDAALPTDPILKLSLHIPLSEGRSLALIHALGRVLHSQVIDSHIDLEAEVPQSIAQRLKLDDFAKLGTSRNESAYQDMRGVN
jgi:GTP-binding protein HflX